MTQEETYLENCGTKCPCCGSDQIEGGHVEVDEGGAWQHITCRDCDSSWNDVYKLVGIVEVDNCNT